MKKISSSSSSFAPPFWDDVNRGSPSTHFSSRHFNYSPDQATASRHRREASGVIKSRWPFSSCRRRARFRSCTTSGGRTPARYAVGTRRTRSRRRMLWASRTSAEYLSCCCAALPLPFSWPSSNSAGIPRKMPNPIGSRCAQRWPRSFDLPCDVTAPVNGPR
jgi:hypothetical protein